MTGKEALKEWINHYQIDCHKYCGDSFLEKLKIIEEYLEELEVENVYLKAELEFSGLLEYETKKELTKYKRAFEILKDTIDFNVFCREVKKGDGVEKTYFIIFGEIWIKINKEEYELLEELMNK